MTTRPSNVAAVAASAVAASAVVATAVAVTASQRTQKQATKKTDCRMAVCDYAVHEVAEAYSKQVKKSAEINESSHYCCQTKQSTMGGCSKLALAFVAAQAAIVCVTANSLGANTATRSRGETSG